MTAATVSIPRHRRVRAPRARRVAGWLAAAALTALGWFALAPTSIGGPTSYVLTSGTSMLPHFHAGGVVLTRAQSDYRVGEVVAYRNRQLHMVVMHRIVARVGDRYVFKGDNNNFRDSYHPTRADLIGREWLYWPSGARWVAVVREPVMFGLILAALGWFAGAGLIGKERV
jgi:signal peptidase I